MENVCFLAIYQHRNKLDDDIYMKGRSSE